MRSIISILKNGYPLVYCHTQALWIIGHYTIVQKVTFDEPEQNKGKAMKYTANNLKKLENILTEASYVLRYERGTFQTGYCIIEERKVVVLNKFLTSEGRIHTLLDLIPQLNIAVDSLTHESQKLYEEVKQLAITAS